MTRSNEQRKAYRRTRKGVLTVRYSDMLRRTQGKLSGDGKALWKGLSLLDRDVFYEWALNNSDFEELFVAWEAAGFPRRLAPSVNRIDRTDGYSIDNIEFVTQLANSHEALAIARVTNARKRALVTA